MTNSAWNSSESPELSPKEREEILNLMERLPASNPVRQAAYAFLKSGGQSMSTIRPLLDSLLDSAASRWREREVAAWLLGRAPLRFDQAEAAVIALTDVLEDSLPPDSRRVWRGFVRWLFLSLALSLPAALLLSRWTHAEPPYFVMVACLAFVVFVIATLLVIPAPLLARSLAAEDGRINRVRAAAATALGRRRATESVGALASAFFDSSSRVRDAARAALYETLPDLTPDHYGALDSQAVPNLCRVLHHAEEPLVLSVLEALEKMGDGRALRYVARLTSGGRSSRIREAASEVLTVLQTRRRQEQAPGRLLRPADPPSVAAASLVRPAELGLRQTRSEQVVLPPEPDKSLRRHERQEK